MPFPWGDKFGQNKKDNDSHLAERGVDSRHPDDIRADYDRQALQILSSLMLKTLDPDRRAKLNLEVQELKIELSDLEKKIEERGPWTPPEISEEGAPSGPLDVSDIFGQSMFMDEDAPVPTSNDSEPNVGTPDDPPPLRALLFFRIPWKKIPPMTRTSPLRNHRIRHFSRTILPRNLLILQPSTMAFVIRMPKMKRTKTKSNHSDL